MVLVGSALLPATGASEVLVTGADVEEADVEAAAAPMAKGLEYWKVAPVASPS